MGFIDDFAFFFLYKKQKPLKQTNIIQASELRIGNYYMNEGRIDQITNGWQISFIRQVISPIPITEEWLKKLGFDKASEQYPHFSIKIFEDVWIERRHGIIILMMGGQFMTIPEIKYIHSLQNLFFSLTGKELTFKTN